MKRIFALVVMIMLIAIAVPAFALTVSPDQFLTSAGTGGGPWLEQGVVTRHTFIADCESEFGNDWVYLDQANEAFYQDWDVSNMNVQNEDYHLASFTMAPASYYQGTFKMQVTWLDSNGSVIRKDSLSHINANLTSNCSTTYKKLNGTAPNHGDIATARIIVAKHNDSKAAIFENVALSFDN